MELVSIGSFVEENGSSYIQVKEEYQKGLTGLEGFSHLTVVWWFDRFEGEEYRNQIEMPKPYRTAPDILGVFATRSPIRPNPLAVTVVNAIKYEMETGRIYITYTDAFPGTPVLDLKPYTPSVERVEGFQVPEWCSHWPKSFEESGEFDWQNEILFD